jgi:hypothetical protein
MVVEAHHIDVLIEWQQVCELAKEATVVFNMIDVGENLDYAVQALCMKKKLLLV